MKATIVTLCIILATAMTAEAQLWTYDPPAMPGSSGTLWNPDGSLGGYYTPPLYPGIDSGKFVPPGGGLGFSIDEPLYPGGSYTIRRGY